MKIFLTTLNNCSYYRKAEIGHTSTNNIVIISTEYFYHDTFDSDHRSVVLTGHAYLRLSEFMLVSGVAVVGDDVLFRAEKEKQQIKIEVEQLKEQLENVGKAKVRNFAQST